MFERLLALTIQAVAKTTYAVGDGLEKFQPNLDLGKIAKVGARAVYGTGKAALAAGCVGAACAVTLATRASVSVVKAAEKGAGVVDAIISDRVRVK